MQELTLFYIYCPLNNKRMSNFLSSANNSLISNGSNITVNLPGVRLNASSQIFAMFPEVGRSINEAAERINKAISDVTKYLDAAYCVGSAIADPTMLLKVLTTMANTATAVAANLAKRMLNLVKNQITEALAVVSGTINKALTEVKDYVDKLASFVNAINDVLRALDSFSLNIKLDAEANWKDFKTQEDCEFMFSMMAACLLSKLMGNKLQELEKDISSKILSEGANLKDAISDSLSSVDNLGNFLEKEQFKLEKATKQVKGINNLINAAAGKDPIPVNTANLKDIAKNSVSKTPVVDQHRAKITGNTLSEMCKQIKNRNK
jgi:hypothetical protein